MRKPRKSLTKRQIIIVTRGEQGRSNNWIKANVDVRGGDFTFNVPLSPTGNLPVTHYWCNIGLDDDEGTSIDGEFRGSSRRVFDGHSTDSDSVLLSINLKRIEESGP